MMLSPKAFIELHKDYSYFQLIDLRNELWDEIIAFENEEKRGTDNNQKLMDPSPQMQYQSSLKYLQEVIKMMAEKYEGMI